MSRTARVKGEDCIYHIIQRGNEKKNIFHDSLDKIRFLQTLKLQQKKYKFDVYSYCLMDNHVHLLVGAAGADISEVMKSLNVSYVQYFNKKYERCGHLFQNRFKSEVVDTEPYLLQASKYIHLNPVAANIVSHPFDFSWSSYGIYTDKGKDEFDLVNTTLILSVFELDSVSAISAYCAFVNAGISSDDAYHRFVKLDIDTEGNREQLINEIITTSKSREEIIIALKNKVGLSCREISRQMDGLSSSTIHRILHKFNP